MSEEEKKAIETVESFLKYYKKNEQTGNRANLDVLGEEVMAIEFILNKYDVQQKELNNLKEIEKSHQEENGKLRIELEQEKEKNKELTKQLNGAFDRGFISKDKIKERMEQTKKVYDEEMKPYMIEVGNGEKVLNVTYLSKKEKEELINKRNCLLVQIKTYEMLLEEK